MAIKRNKLQTLLAFLLYLMPGVSHGESSSIAGRVVQIDESRTRAAVVLTERVALEIGDILLPEPRRKPSEKIDYLSSEQSCNLIVKDTHRTNRNLARRKENVVIVDMTRCKTIREFNVGSRVVQNLFESSREPPSISV